MTTKTPKTNTKLVLSRETLRALTAQDLKSDVAFTRTTTNTRDRTITTNFA